MQSILRQPDGLYVLEYWPKTPWVAPEVNAPMEARPHGEVLRAARPDDRVLNGEQTFAALERLCSVTEPSAEVLADLFFVLVASVPDPLAYRRDLPALSFERVEAPRPTAAHPRAFRGTKHKPPKAAAPVARDLLPYLDGGALEAATLAHFEPVVDDALALYRARGGVWWEPLEEHRETILEPYGQVYEPRLVAALRRMPVAFRRSFASLLKVESWDNARQLLAAYRSLNLDDDVQLRWIVASRFMPYVGHSYDELRALGHMRPERCTVFADEGALRLWWRDADGLVAAVEELDALCSDDSFRHRAHAFCDNCSFENMAARYLLDGFRLANRYAPSRSFDDEMLPCRRVDGERRDGVADGALGPEALPSRLVVAIEAIMERLQDHPEEYEHGGRALAIWKACGELVGLLPVLEEIPWQELDTETTAELVKLLCTTGELEEDVQDVKWPILRARADVVVQLLRESPEGYRGKAHRALAEVLWLDYPLVEVSAALDAALELLPKLCQPPYAKQKTLGDTLGHLCLAGERFGSALALAPESSFSVLEKACKVDGTRERVTAGIWNLSCCLPDLTREAFTSLPGALVRVAGHVGAVSKALARTVLRELTSTTLFEAAPAELDVTKLVELVDASSSRPSRLVSKRLRQYFAGEQSLSAGQLARAKARLVAGWAEVLLNAVDEAILAAASESLGDDADMRDPAARHAALILQEAWVNQRGLRRALKARFAGEDDYVLSHPESQRWFREHPEVSPHLWTHGIVQRQRLDTDDPESEVVLRLEREPFEVLRLGSYVGSCLALGGSQSYSAAAVLLDVNKQVIYARDRRGHVLGRQLLAISDTGQLVCFDVYPASASERLQELFWEYDWAFAEALGVELYDPEAPEEADGYHGSVRFVLAHDWWRDNAVQPL